MNSKNYAEYYFGSDNGKDFSITKTNGVKLYVLSPGLSGESNTISFESADKPGFYLRDYEFLLDMESRENGRNKETFDKDATFKLNKNTFYDGFYALESVSHPDYYIRHEGLRLKISKQDNTELFKNDASFKVVTRTIVKRGKLK